MYGLGVVGMYYREHLSALFLDSWFSWWFFVWCGVVGQHAMGLHSHMLCCLGALGEPSCGGEWRVQQHPMLDVPLAGA